MTLRECKIENVPILVVYAPPTQEVIIVVTHVEARMALLLAIARVIMNFAAKVSRHLGSPTSHRV